VRREAFPMDPGLELLFLDELAGWHKCEGVHRDSRR
jgi:hypothetical protein